MNLIKRIVKETALLPWRVAQGIAAAVDEVTEPKPEKKGRA